MEEDARETRRPAVSVPSSPPSPVRPRRRGRRVALGLVAALLGALLAAEVGLRVGWREPLKDRHYPLIYEPDPLLGYRYVPGIRDRICLPSICKPVEINAHGFPGPDFSDAKPPGVFRIAVVGSSQATGIWMDGEHAFPELLEERLNAEGGRRFEVLNCSVDGQNREYANILRAETVVAGFDPDLVLLNLGTVNVAAVVGRRVQYRGYVCDLGHSGEPPAQLAATRERLERYVDDLDGWLPARVYDASFTFRAFCHWYAGRMEERDFHFLDDCFGHRIDAYRRKRLEVFEPVEFLGPERTIVGLRGTRDELAKIGCDLVVFFYENLPELLRPFEEVEVPLVLLDIPDDPELVHRHDGHYDQDGHELVAERLFERLAERWRAAREEG